MIVKASRKTARYESPNRQKTLSVFKNMNTLGKSHSPSLFKPEHPRIPFPVVLRGFHGVPLCHLFTYVRTPEYHRASQSGRILGFEFEGSQNPGRDGHFERRRLDFAAGRNNSSLYGHLAQLEWGYRQSEVGRL